MTDVEDPGPVIDAHQHFWNLDHNPYPWLQDPVPIPFRYGDYSALRRNYLPADFERDIRPFRVVKSVHVEAEWDRSDPVAETRWLECLAAREGRPTACVAYAALEHAAVAEVLHAHATLPLVRGIRQKPAAAPSPAAAVRGQPGSMDDPLWRRGYALLARHGLSFDLQTPWSHLEAAAELAADFPQTRIIINHTGLPVDRSPEGLSGWRRALDRVSTSPNVALKISGLGQRDGPWSIEANGPVIRDAIAIFGADRCMFASNYPVDSLVASYGTILRGFLAATADLPLAARRKLLHDNAERIYRL
jgi:predicted TIM-barrel fold metal-dependent hydrolase